MHFAWELQLGTQCAVGVYAWTGGKEFGVHIGLRKYLYECTPFGYVNLWNLENTFLSVHAFECI